MTTSGDTATANEDGRVPDSAAGAAHTGEATTSEKDTAVSGPVVPPQVATPASGEQAKDTVVSGAAAPEQRNEPPQASAPVKDAPVSGSAAPSQQAPQAKVALPLARPPQAQGKPAASG